METTPWQVTGALAGASVRSPSGAGAFRRLWTATLLAVLVLIAVVAAGTRARSASVDGTLRQPAPLAAPAPAAADYPEHSRIAACWTLASQSNALAAPRSNRASDVIGPIYGDACLDA